MRHHWHHHVELEVSVRARPGDGRVVADHLLRKPSSSIRT